MASMLAAATVMAQPKVVAHRGYWDTPGSAQNSIRALVKADSIGCYGSEFDVWLTADKQLVVNHDDHINGHVIETSDAATITSQKLPNGENVPTLEQYLDAALKLKTMLVLEIKPHKDAAHETLAVKMAVAMVDKKGLSDRTVYITFSKNACLQLVKATHRPVFYLTGTDPDQLKKMGVAGADFHIDEFRKNHPDWLKRLRDLGMEINVWTVNDRDGLQWCIDHHVDYITTNAPVLTEELIRAGQK